MTAAENSDPPRLLAYALIGGGKVAHLLREVADPHGDRPATARAVCGVAGDLTARTEADEKAIRVDLGAVCTTCLERLTQHPDVAIVARTDRRRPRSNAGQGRSTMTTSTDTRKKAASAPLLDRDAYGSTDPARLRQERFTINNRISGLKTQIKRAADDKAKTATLEARLDDMNARRAAIAQELAGRPAPDLDAATHEQAALAAGTADAAADLVEAEVNDPDREPRASEAAMAETETPAPKRARKASTGSRKGSTRKSGTDTGSKPKTR